MVGHGLHHTSFTSPYITYSTSTSFVCFFCLLVDVLPTWVCIDKACQVSEDVANLRMWQSWLNELAEPELTAVYAESQDKNTRPAVSSEMVFATARDVLLHHTSEIVSALCDDADVERRDSHPVHCALLGRQHRPAPVSDDELHGEVLLHLGSIVKTSLPPTESWWFRQGDSESLYADRLLISVRMERAEKPSLVVSPNTPVSEPATIPVCSGQMSIRSASRAQMLQTMHACCCRCRQRMLSLQTSRRRGEAFIREEDAGRLPELDLEIPALHMCSDIICSVVVQRDVWLRRRLTWLSCSVWD